MKSNTLTVPSNFINLMINVMNDTFSKVFKRLVH